MSGAVALIWLATPLAAALAQQADSGGAAAALWAADPLDWPNWRGPQQNRISPETGLIDKWDPKGTNVLWKSAELATRSTPIVLRGKLYTLCAYEPDTPRAGERVVCADAATGEILWQSPFNVYLSDVPKERVGWSCCVGDPETGRIYALGVCGFFQCLDGETGETIWSRSLSEEYGLLSTYGGRTNVPVLHEDLVIISGVVIGWGEMAVPAHRFLAFDKHTGEVVWFNGTRLRPSDTTYSTPTVAVLAGQAAMVFGSGDGAIWAFQPRTGVPIWNYQLSQRGLNVSPLVDGDTIYMGQSEENPDDTSMGAFCAVNGAAGQGDITKDGELWRIKEVMVGKTSPIKIEDRIYALDDGNILYVLEAATGRQIDKIRLTGTIARATPLYADGKIYACTTSAWHVLEPTSQGAKIIHRLRFRQGEEVHGSPIASHGRIYLPTTDHMYCLGSVDARHADAPANADAVPQPREDPIEDNLQPTHVQVVPAESLIEPGESVQYKVRLFNDRGQFLEEADSPEFSVDAGGKIDAGGLFKSDDGSNHAGATVTVKAGELSGKARIRVVPPLPWKFDFAGGYVPVNWVGIRYRHIGLDFDLLESLRNENPRASQLYIYLTTSFINGGTDTVRYNDRTPRRTWNVLLRYLALNETPALRSLDEAKRELEPALERLSKENVLAKWEWESQKPGDVQLSVVRGNRKVDGNGAMVKITTIPLGTRSQGWMGQADLHDYTIQADLRGDIVDGKLPDMGLIAQRYTLDMQGVNQVLQIRSWTPQLERFSKTIPFTWKENVWYTMKFQASVDDGKAILRGKVWPRDESEPDEWTIEAADEAPNLVGSPGLFGNAINAEVLVDNITVSAN